MVPHGFTDLGGFFSYFILGCVAFLHLIFYAVKILFHLCERCDHVLFFCEETAGILESRHFIASGHGHHLGLELVTVSVHLLQPIDSDVDLLAHSRNETQVFSQLTAFILGLHKLDFNGSFRHVEGPHLVNWTFVHLL